MRHHQLSRKPVLTATRRRPPRVWLPLTAVALAAALWRLGRAVGISRFLVEGASMSPTLLPGDRLLVLRLPRWSWDPRPGQLVVARPPPLEGREVIKRVDAVVRPRGGSAYVLLGDNPEASTDSRHFGPVTRNRIVGRVWLRYWPDHRRGRVG